MKKHTGHIIAQTSSVCVSRSSQLPLNDTPHPQEPWRRTLLLKNGEYACIQNEQRTYVVILRRVLSQACSRWGCTWLSTFNLQWTNANKHQTHPGVCLGAKRHIATSSPSCLEACNGLTLLLLLLSSFTFYSHYGPQWPPAITETLVYLKCMRKTWLHTVHGTLSP